MRKIFLIIVIFLYYSSYCQILRINGDFQYNFTHAVGSADSITFVTGATSNTYYKINTGVMSWHDVVGLTAIADCVRTNVLGDYEILCAISATTSNVADKIRVKLYMNGATSPLSIGRWIINSNGNNNGDANTYFWYLHSLPANTYLSVRVTNQTANRTITITDYKFYIKKTPEN